MQPVRALLLDLGDTLFRLHPMPVDIPARVASATGLDEPQAADIIEDVKALTVVEPGGPEANLEAAAAEAISRTGLDPGARLVDAIVREFHLADVRRFEAPPTLATTMRSLRTMGLRVCAVSNTTTSPLLLRSYLAAIGIEQFFDAFVFSVTVGVKKPNPRIYEAALEAVSVAPGEALFVGDRVREDVHGPSALGMRAVLTHQFRQEEPVGVQPLTVVSHLDEVTRLLVPSGTASGE